MANKTILFTVRRQHLHSKQVMVYFPSNIVNYIAAEFDMDEEWNECDVIKAVWYTEKAQIATVLESGSCIVPQEVLVEKSKVYVNLVGSVIENGESIERITSYPYLAIVVDKDAKIDGSETVPVTPSQFEQFVNAVINETRKVTGMTATVETLPSGSEATASYSDGVLSLGIPKGDTGEKGDKGDKGESGEKGEKGDTGEKGDKGDKGEQGIKGDKGDPFTFDDFTPEQLASLKGEKGDKGDKGDTGDTGPQGETGPTGATGADGVSPTVTITPITGGHRITITDADGEHSADVMDGTGNVDDVQINGSSIVEDGVAKLPIVESKKQNAGIVAKTPLWSGVYFTTGGAFLTTPTSALIKQGTDNSRTSLIHQQHISVFYGLAKAASDTTQSSSSNAVGSYTDTAKGKIQTMLGIADLIGNSEEATASKAYSVGDVLLHDGKLYKVTASITQGSAIVPNTNCTQTTIIDLLRGV